MDVLVPLALAAIIFCAWHNYEGPDWPDVRTATRVEMWLRCVTVISYVCSLHISVSIGQIWHTDDDAQLERDRRAYFGS
jgi:hypothetical protein